MSKPAIPFALLVAALLVFSAPAFAKGGGKARALPNLRVTPATVVLVRVLANLRVTPATVVLVRVLANLRVTPATVVLVRVLANLRVTPATVVLVRVLPNLRVTPATVVLVRALANLPWEVSRSRNSASNQAAMSARPLHVMLMGAAVILSTIAPVPTFAKSGQTDWNVQDLYKQCKGVQGSLGKVFCWNLFQV